MDEVDILLFHQVMREWDLVSLLRRTREGTEHPDEKGDCTKEDARCPLVCNVVWIARHCVSWGLDTA